MMSRQRDEAVSERLKQDRTSPVPAPMRLETSNVDRVERNIRPLLRQAVTLPVRVGNKDLGLSVYVTSSAFADPISDQAVIDIAEMIARRFNGQ